jgi:hypothetical protein
MVNIIIPKKPVSSPIIASIESVGILGKKRYFCSELPRPLPKMPPEPMLKIS